MTAQPARAAVAPEPILLRESVGLILVALYLGVLPMVMAMKANGMTNGHVT